MSTPCQNGNGVSRKFQKIECCRYHFVHAQHHGYLSASELFFICSRQTDNQGIRRFVVSLTALSAPKVTNSYTAYSLPVPRLISKQHIAHLFDLVFDFPCGNNLCIKYTSNQRYFTNQLFRFCEAAKVCCKRVKTSGSGPTMDCDQRSKTTTSSISSFRIKIKKGYTNRS